MCPGGYVVNASSICNHLAINGMSNHERDSENANSAIVVTVGPSDFGDNPMDGIKFQEKLEKKAYELGRGQIPVQLLKDYRKIGYLHLLEVLILFLKVIIILQI